MSYDEFKERCTNLRIPLSKVSEEVGMTPDGLKKALRSESLAIRYIPTLCKSLCISPDEFFGVNRTGSGDINYGNMQKNGKKQIMHTGGSEELKETVELLRAQVATKDEQIRAQNEQIVQLIAKIK